jgi:hypothetical protein
MQDVASLQGIGGQAQQQRQRELDAQRAGLLQAQQAPLAQYQALMPFVNMSPAGTSYCPDAIHAAAIRAPGWYRHWFGNAWGFGAME